MSVLTLKHDRKTQYARAKAKRQAEADAALMAKAIKAYRKTLPPAPSLEQEVEALETYIDSLIALRRELQTRYGADPDWKTAIYDITHELKEAARLLVDKRISTLKANQPDIFYGRQ